MNTLLSLPLWFALLMSPCCGNAENHEEESTTADYDYMTATADYDYTATFDYYIVTGLYRNPDASNKASGIGQLSPVLLLGLAVHQIWN